ncbi:class I SAM-dependent methyltransferase [Soonwooa sp.]|uniref:class I SAM-dependent methyltransferase n=1 Tax=Soonwooa sp. TaxID=1938592 RepID=UPI002638E151|nr:class I SAM-dependent methyltransferase [Soonwooa sp.]
MSQQHWENVYENKTPEQMSWTQDEYATSLKLIQSLNADKNSKIIDVGGGDGSFVQSLLDLGFQDITVLNISEAAIENAKTRLGDNASKIKWIVSDITKFQPVETYDIWHDRATFHFLTEKKDIQTYVDLLGSNLNGNLIIGTFSTDGPLKCSGLDITQYSESSMENLLKNNFEKIECFTQDHTTPFDTTQNFLFCNFKKINS